MKRICLTLTALTLLLLLTGCAVRDSDTRKDSYLVLHKIGRAHV